MTRRETEDRDADLAIGHLRLWVHGRENPEAVDFWDGNWLNVSATYRRGSSAVSASGTFVHGSEIASLLNQLETLSTTLRGDASLPTMEPNLKVTLVGNGRRQVELKVQITPNHLQESHDFLEEIDQTHLPGIASQCRKILEKNPVRDPEKLAGRN